MYIKTFQVLQYNSPNLSGIGSHSWHCTLWHQCAEQMEQCPGCVFRSKTSIKSHGITPGSSAKNTSDLLHVWFWIHYWLLKTKFSLVKYSISPQSIIFPIWCCRNGFWISALEVLSLTPSSGDELVNSSSRKRNAVTDTKYCTSFWNHKLNSGDCC